MTHYQILCALGFANMCKQTADIANNDKMYLMLCPYHEMAQSNGSFHHSFVAVIAVAE